VLLIQIATFIYNNWINRGRDQSAKVEEAWFRAIVLDDALPSLQGFLSMQLARFLELANDQVPTVSRHVKFQIQYKNDLETLMRKFSMTECLSTRAMQSVILAVETLDDIVAKNASIVQDGSIAAASRVSAVQEVAAAFDTCLASCTGKWRDLHKILQQGADPDRLLANPA
jgi:hypothetical protein